MGGGGGGGGEELGWVPLGGGRRVEICMMGICGGGESGRVGCIRSRV